MFEQVNRNWPPVNMILQLSAPALTPSPQSPQYQNVKKFHLFIISCFVDYVTTWSIVIAMMTGIQSAVSQKQ